MRNLSSRGETAANHIERVLGLVNRIEASGVEAGCSGVAPHSPGSVRGTGDTQRLSLAGLASGLASSLECTKGPTRGLGSNTRRHASSLVVTLRCDFHPSAADLGALGNTSRRAFFCSHEYRRACNSLERISVRCKTKFPSGAVLAPGVFAEHRNAAVFTQCASRRGCIGSVPSRDRSSIAQSGSLQNCQMGVRIPPVAPSTRAAAGLLSVRLLGFLARASGIAGQSSPLSRSAA